VTSDLTTDPTRVPVADAVRELAAVPLDDVAREAARLRLVDTLFAVAVGRRTEQGRRSAAVGDSLHGSRSVAGRAFRLAASCRMTEIDDIDLLSCTTPGAIVVPTVLAVLGSPAAAGGVSADLLAVVARGYEVAVGLGEGIDGPVRLGSGVWPSLVVSTVTAAAVTTMLLDGDAGELERSVVLAAAQSIGGNPRGTAREHLFAAGVVAGIGSALAVRHGFEVVGSRGDGALGRLLREPVRTTSAPRVTRPKVKTFCSARQAMTSVASLRQLLAQAPVGQVERIDVEVPHEYAAMLDKPQVLTRRDSVSSIAYQLALALRRPSGLLDVARSDLHVDELAPLMARVHVHGADDLSARYPASWPGRVRMTAGGVSTEATADAVPGEDELTAAALTIKMTDFATVSPDLATPAGALASLTAGPVDTDHLLDLLDVVEGEPRSLHLATHAHEGATA
jgi:2-methylcitrate dehydratase PrpD